MADSESSPRYVGTQALYVVNFSDKNNERIATVINNDRMPVPDVGETINLQEVEFDSDNLDNEYVFEDSEVINRRFEYRYVTDDSDVVDTSDVNLENAVIHLSDLTVKPI